MEETIVLDRDEVLAHLKHILGQDFSITEEQLESFMHDLRKLIRKDQKNLLRENKNFSCHCNIENESISEKASCSDDSESVDVESVRKTAPLRSASSFIRPWNIRPGIKKGKNLKEDPVKLYHHYQNAWRRYRFPGETGHSDLRWSVREKMLGQDPNPRPVSRLSSQR